MRLIDADALIELIPKTSQSKFENCWTCKLLSAETVKEIINSAPTIEIVRCKECKWLDSGKNDSEIWSMCTRHFGKHIDVNADDFCSYGEKQTERSE